MIVPPGLQPSYSSINATTTTSFVDANVFAGLQSPGNGWSSIIGIVTAIIGNVLISFALNTQRYAHIRIQREANGQSAQLNDKSKESKKQNYGTTQEDIAEERAKLNAQDNDGPPQMYEPDDHSNDLHEHDETDALIPPMHRRSDSEDSSSTVLQDEKTQPQGKKNYLRSPYWWIGICLMVVGEAGNFLAYGFAPASIVSPLGVVALVSNCIIAPIMLKERFRMRDLLGIVIAVGGTVTVVLSAKGSNPKLGPREIVELLKRWEFLTYFGITTGAIVILMYVSNKYGEKTIAIDIGLVGLFGGYTALSTKGVASLLSYRLFHVLRFPITYLLIVVLVFTAIMQIKYVNRALQRFDSTQVIPTQFVTFTFSVIVGSAILYRDFENATAKDLGMFVGGVALTFFGVWCITGGRNKQSNREGSDDDDEEARISLVDEEAEEEEEEEEAEESSNNRHASSSTPQPNRRRSSEVLLTNSTSSPSLASFTTANSSIRSTPNATPEFLQPPQHPRTISTPTLPLRNQSLLQPPSTPFNTLRPGPSPRSQTEASTIQTAAPTSPNRRSEAQQLRGVLNRHSSLVERMLGPLTSPLSSSALAAVVADSLRKGEFHSSPVEMPSGSYTVPRVRRRTTDRSRRASNVDGGGSGSRRASNVVVGGSDSSTRRASNVVVDEE